MLYRTLPLLLLTLGCKGDDKGETQDTVPDTGEDEYVDADGDGYFRGEDCDDTDAQVNPGETEICNSLDDNCDGAVDEGVLQTFYADADDDGYGDPDSPVESCQIQEGTVPTATDCDDTEDTVFPGAPEYCDELDNDCDGSTDEDSVTTFFLDTDGDGYGDPEAPVEGCDPPEDAVEDDSDCDDEDPNAFPGNAEICDGVDNDCDGDIDDELAEDRSPWYQDRDGDGYGDAALEALACAQPDGYVADDTDCDDLSAGTFPGADEVCDDADNDCDSETDEDAIDALTWYRDADEDGHGDAASTAAACAAPEGYVATAEDCDDDDGAVNPEADEVCNGGDDDCDGDADEDAIDALAWYEDEDGDGYGDPADSVPSCEAPAGYLADASDCDDADAAEHPGADEVCDGDDDDCDGEADEDSAVDAPTWYQDRDDDGYGDPARGARACAAPDGYLADDTDCDDLSAGTFPGADEVCDDADNDCDSETDEDALDALTWYADTDGDGYGDAELTEASCDAPSGYVADDTDCDDGDGAEHPGADEVCDGDDDDCDGSVDEDSAIDADTWYQDRDGDGYGDAGSTDVACSAPSGYVANSRDCDDGDRAENPAASEVCDGDDDDCDGSVDEDSAIDADTWYQDRDGDGYGDEGSTKAACSAPSGYVADDTDCDDFADESYPGASEVCDDEDNDCDSVIDDDAVDAGTWYRDADSDRYGNPAVAVESCDAPTGYVSDGTDCDDTDSANRPGGTETCDDEDNDCDGSVDEAGAVGESSWYPDADSDGYGSSTGTARTACDAPSGYVSSSTDCDDTDADVNPGETEYCDGVDQDCDGDEDGAVHFETITGTKTSVTSTWASGTASSPKSISLSSNGTVYVCPGTYYVSVTSSATALEIEGLYGTDSTTLSGGGSKRVVSATGDLTLRGLTITDGYTSTSYGGDVYINGSDGTLEDVVLSDGYARWGGNLACRNGTLTLSEVDISGGDGSYGGGIYLNACTMEATTALIYDNTATYGAGLYLTGSDATIDDADITGNDATSYGGGFALVSSSSVTTTATEVNSNAGGDYGGGAYLSGSTYTMSTSNISYNASTLVGGGVYLTGVSDFTCSGSSGATYGVWGNTSLLAGGAYLAATSGASITSSTCDWTGSLDNDLYDIVVGLYLYYTKGNNATFTCDYLGC